mmetsp:Transcript_3408/g.4065  ORF Transcript_3408/g.4065 Transcript_3408/m.4065 type:complete len:174 (+) Transcript_3408:120-641(+)
MRGTNQDIRLTLVAIIGLSYMMGMLFNDLVFNLAAPDVSKVYYCTLLESLTKFPEIFRLLIPLFSVGIIMCLKVYRVYFTSFSVAHTPLAGRLELGTFLLLSVFGSFSFFQSVSTAYWYLCPENPNPGTINDAIAVMINWQYAIGFIIFTAMAFQCCILLTIVDNKAKWNKIE